MVKSTGMVTVITMVMRKRGNRISIIPEAYRCSNNLSDKKILKASRCLII